MEVRNCKGCGRLFNYLSGMPLCANCQKDLEDKYDLVKAYLYDHPGASIQQVSEENDVSIPQLKKWVKEERLEFTAESAIGIECEKCGKPIRTGRFCPQCKDKINSKLDEFYPEKKVREEKKKTQATENKMRFLNQ